MTGSMPMFRLTSRGCDGLCCDVRGVALGPVALVEAAEANGRRVYRVRPAEEIARTLALAYDPFAPDDLARRLSSLDVAARALEAGDMAKAMVATVLLKLPSLSDEAIAKLACNPTLKKYSPDQPRDERGRWTSGASGAVDASDETAAKPIRIAANDTGVMSDAGGILPAADKPVIRDNRGVRVVLPDGSQVWDPYTKAPLISPFADLREVAAAGRAVGAEYFQSLNTPEAAAGANPFLYERLWSNLGHGGTFDYQREANDDPNSGKRFKQLRQFRDVANFNVRLFSQQAGLTLNETLGFAGSFAYWRSSNSRPDQPYDLDARTADLIRIGYRTGESGVFGPAAPRSVNESGTP